MPRRFREMAMQYEFLIDNSARKSGAVQSQCVAYNILMAKTPSVIGGITTT